MKLLLQLLCLLCGLSLLASAQAKAKLAVEDATTEDPMEKLVHFRDEVEQHQFAQIMSDMGFTSVAMHLLSAPTFLVGKRGPLTVFAPTERAFINGTHHFSLKNHVVTGYFPYLRLQALRDATMLDCLEPRHAVVITFAELYTTARAPGDRPVYVNGVALSHPDVFNDGLLVVHGVDEILGNAWSEPRQEGGAPTSAAHPSGNPSLPMRNVITPLALKDVALSVRDRGFSILALALRIKAAELLSLQNFTVFALADDSIFLPGGQDFVNSVRYHIVPNHRLRKVPLVDLPVGTVLETLIEGRSLVVTGRKPFALNCIELKSFEVFVNKWIAVHEIPRPLSHIPPAFPFSGSCTGFPVGFSAAHANAGR